MTLAARRRMALWLAATAAAAWARAAPPEGPHGLLLQGAEAEAFLSTAKVVSMKAIPVGIARPQQVTLSLGDRTLRAVWKTIDEQKTGVTNFDGGGFEVDFRDSYKLGIATYELDKLIGLELVPPTIEREIDGKTGSLQLWVEGCITEWDRKQKNLKAPDLEQWNRQMYKVRLLHNLTYDTDAANIRNVIVDTTDFRVFAIDNSRTFRRYDKLMAPKDLTRFSRPVVERLKALDVGVVHEKLGRWLGRYEIEGLMKRRDLIVALAAQLVAERGEDAVLYP